MRCLKFICSVSGSNDRIIGDIRARPTVERNKALLLRQQSFEVSVIELYAEMALSPRALVWLTHLINSEVKRRGALN